MNPNPPYPTDGAATDLNTDPPATDRPKSCRGCQDRMPAVCTGCGQKTPAYCPRCRPNRTTRPADSTDLTGRLGVLMRTQPLPTFGAITGWTVDRAAVHLPGHTPAGILLALRRLADTGQAVLIGENPERYRPLPLQ